MTTQINKWREELGIKLYNFGRMSDRQELSDAQEDIEQFVQEQITLAKAEGAKEALAKAREVLGVDEAYINLLTQEITTLEETKRQERKRIVEIIENEVARAKRNGSEMLTDKQIKEIIGKID